MAVPIRTSRSRLLELEGQLLSCGRNEGGADGQFPGVPMLLLVEGELRTSEGQLQVGSKAIVKCVV